MCRCSVYIVFLFFFKQKTAYEMRISDWSSDVCSSDLRESLRLRQARGSHVTSTDCLALVEHPATQNRDICRDVPCLWALTRSRSGFGSILSPTPQPSASDRRRPLAGERDRANDGDRSEERVRGNGCGRTCSQRGAA